MKKWLRHPTKDIYREEGDELVGIRIVLCITGSVAAYKAVDMARLLVKHGAEVYTVMSPKTSKIFLSQEMMKWATGNEVVTELTGELEHILLADREAFDIVIVYPCTANTIGKLASGIDDTVVTSVVTVAIGSNIPIIICPAMHEAMYNNNIVWENIKKLKAARVIFLDPHIDKGKAKLISANEVFYHILNRYTKKDRRLVGQNFLITAGSTAEYVDPIRVIMNMSSGKMGMSLAKEAHDRGADVTIIYGYGSVDPMAYLQGRAIKIRRISTRQEMFESVISELSTKKYDVVILASATSDFSPANRWNEKIESNLGKIDITLVPVDKIISKIKDICGYEVFLIGFKAEYNVEPSDLVEKAFKKLLESRADLVVANDVGKQNTGFGSDNNEVYIVDQQRNTVHLPIQTKEKVSKDILDLIERKYHNSGASLSK